MTDSAVPLTPLAPPPAGAALSDWLAYIEALHACPIDMGLDRVADVAHRMGWPLSPRLLTLAGSSFNPDLPPQEGDPVIITVSGTNGKGSTCAMLDSILQQSGYRVGLYTSPHLLDFNERCHVNGNLATDAELVAAFERVQRARGDVSLTYFEFSTLAIMDVFVQHRLDVWVLEVGLGGRLDAVNILNADCAIITSVDLDHMEYLGPTREHIGREKAGIFRSGRPAVVSDPDPPASVAEVASNIGADLWLFARDFNYQGDRQQWGYAGRSQRRGALAYPALRGANQLLNASAALAALEALRDRLAIAAQSVRQGFALVDWPGRFQVLPGRPAIVLDVAHNPHAAGHLRSNLDNMGFHPFTHAVFGMLADKDVAEVVRLIKDRVDHWHLVPTSGPRGLSVEQLRAILAEQGIDAPAFDWAAAAQARRSGGITRQPPEKSVQEYPDAGSAWALLPDAVDANDRIVVFGSFLTVAAVMRARQRQRAAPSVPSMPASAPPAA